MACITGFLAAEALRSTDSAADQRGAYRESEPPDLRRLGFDPDHWTGQVKGIGSAYWRIVGTAEAIMAKAEAIGQEWMNGIGYAR